METVNSQIKDLEQCNQNSDKAKQEHINGLQGRGRGNSHSRNNKNAYQPRKLQTPPSVCGRSGPTEHQSRT